MHKHQTEQSEDVDVAEKEHDLYQLIVWNDDVNTFDWVAKTLVDICEMEEVQAEQCSIIIHYKGKCAVKHGDFSTLRKKCEAIIDRGINATVEN